MSLWTLTLIALGVSADAFAVAVGKGLTMPRLSRRGAVLIAVAFGAFQGLMPLLGWLLGSGLEGSIESVDHWIAFGLLAAVGGKMLHEAVHDDDLAADPEPVRLREPVAPDGSGVAARAGEVRPSPGRLRASVPARELVLLSVATSVDALAVGISFAFLEVRIGSAVLLIALVTFALSLVGVAVGRAAGARWRQPAEVCGGLVLIGIGTKILLEHLHVL
jgi:putative Mn2+ efflux pump MntP